MLLGYSNLALSKFIIIYIIYLKCLFIFFNYSWKYKVYCEYCQDQETAHQLYYSLYYVGYYSQYFSDYYGSYYAMEADVE